MFKTIMTTVAATGFVVGAAFAAETEGTVSAYDPTTRMVLLESGEAFVVPEDVAADDLAPGTRIKIVFAEGSTDAEEITVMQ